MDGLLESAALVLARSRARMHRRCVLLAHPFYAGCLPFNLPGVEWYHRPSAMRAQRTSRYGNPPDHPMEFASLRITAARITCSTICVMPAPMQRQADRQSERSSPYAIGSLSLQTLQDFRSSDDAQKAQTFRVWGAQSLTTSPALRRDDARQNPEGNRHAHAPQHSACTGRWIGVAAGRGVRSTQPQRSPCRSRSARRRHRCHRPALRGPPQGHAWPDLGS